MIVDYLTIGIFCLAFALIVFEVFDKSLVALAGALLMVIVGTLTPHEAISAVEFETILLLLSMMILVNIASRSNIFMWLNTKIVSLTKGNPLALFILFSLVTAIFSAFLDNVTTVILIVPLTIELIKGMGKDPKPYIFTEIIFSNIGGALTLVGDPPNIIIGGAKGFSFLDFILNLWMPILAVSTATILVLIIKNWKKLRPISNNLVELHIANILIEKIKRTFLRQTLHKEFIIKVIAVIVLTLAGFMFQKMIGLPTYIIALIGALLLGFLCSKRVNIHDAFKSVEWTTLFFFAGLFVMVAGVEKTGLLEMLSEYIAHSTSNVFFLSLIILWISGLVSMILDNIPFVTIMIPVILGIEAQLPGVDVTILWWALSLGACLGGNATLVGASANLVSADLAKKKGVNISFLEYTKFSLPLTLLMLIICSGYLFLRTL